MDEPRDVLLETRPNDVWGARHELYALQVCLWDFLGRGFGVDGARLVVRGFFAEIGSGLVGFLGRGVGPGFLHAVDDGPVVFGAVECCFFECEVEHDDGDRGDDHGEPTDPAPAQPVSHEPADEGSEIGSNASGQDVDTEH